MEEKKTLQDYLLSAKDSKPYSWLRSITGCSFYCSSNHLSCVILNYFNFSWPTPIFCFHYLSWIFAQTGGMILFDPLWAVPRILYIFKKKEHNVSIRKNWALYRLLNSPILRFRFRFFSFYLQVNAQ